MAGHLSAFALVLSAFGTPWSTWAVDPAGLNVTEPAASEASGTPGSTWAADPAGLNLTEPAARKASAAAFLSLRRPRAEVRNGTALAGRASTVSLEEEKEGGEDAENMSLLLILVAGGILALVRYCRGSSQAADHGGYRMLAPTPTSHARAQNQWSGGSSDSRPKKAAKPGR
mmetsp:Transcript_12324/g.33768  ORF Transcript_12324/g.33768 Transcript_12324/m.33768 type:complete len:172 (-) Transcript_12324:54-569(-)